MNEMIIVTTRLTADLDLDFIELSWIQFEETRYPV